MLTEYEIALQSQANFTINVLNQIVTSNEGVAFSPYSLTLALAMCFIGAGGKTEIEFKNLLSPNVDKAKYLEFLEDSVDKINILTTRKIEIFRLIYNFYKKEYELDPSLNPKFEKYLKSELKYVDTGDSKSAAKTITEILKKLYYYELSDIITSDDINLSTIGDNIYVANKLFLQKDYPIEENYNENMKKYFKATIEDVDYNDSITAAKAINDFVKKITHDKIDNIINPISIDSSTKAVLVNALYFKSQWYEKFYKELTEDSEFFITSNKKRTVKMMIMKRELLYATNENFHVVKLLYVNRNSSFVLVLPKIKNTLHSHLKNLNSSNLLNLIRSTAPEEIKLSMPRFKIESSFNLKEPLIKMGLITAFNAKANFSSITSRNDFIINYVGQKVFVEVNEEGTDSIAVQYFQLKEAMYTHHVKKEIIVRADHPFLYFILNNDDILISGIYQ